MAAASCTKQCGDASGNVDLWEADVAGGEPRRLTFGPMVEFYPVCSPTGGEVMFASARSGIPNIYRMTTTAPGTETQLTDSVGAKALTDWSRDGKFVWTRNSRPTPAGTSG